nr:MAG TPA: hypothetical protein [Caudoviricetes sp.]
MGILLLVEKVRPVLNYRGGRVESFFSPGMQASSEAASFHKGDVLE